MNTIVVQKKSQNAYKISWSEILFTSIIAFGVVVMLIPFIWMLLASLKTNVDFYESSLIPKEWVWNNYIQFFTDKNLNYPLYLLNSLKVTSLTIIGRVVSCSIVAFAFARLRFPGRKILFVFVLVSMFLPRQVTLIPVFLIIKKLGWYNSHLSLVVRPFLGEAFGIFLLRQFYLSIPRELDQAARIDGCSWFKIYSKIYVPLIKPALITLSIIGMQDTWGEVLRPMIFLRDSKLFTLVLGIQKISDSQYLPQPQLEIAGYVLMLLPVMLIYIFAQKHFTESIAASGLKG